MTKKGKKKKVQQNVQEETSTAAQKTPGPAQQQVADPSRQQQPASGPSHQQQQASGPSRQQQPAFDPSRQQQPASGPSRQQQQASGPSRQQQQASGPSRQQQPASDPSRQQQPASGPSRQQQPASGPSRQQQPASGPSRQQQPASGPSRQQQPISGPSRQQQQASGPSRQQQPASGPSYQQLPASGPSSAPQLQGAWAARKQQQETSLIQQQSQPRSQYVPQGPPLQQQPISQQQQVQTGQPLQQQQTVPQALPQQPVQWGPSQQQQTLPQALPQQPVPWGLRQQRPPGPAQQQQRPPGPPQQQQQRPPGPPQQQQTLPQALPQQPVQWSPPQQQQTLPQALPQQPVQWSPPQQQQTVPQALPQQPVQWGPSQQQQTLPQALPQQPVPWGLQQQRPPGPPQQQQRPPGPPQQQQRLPGPPQQQQRPPGPSQQRLQSSSAGPSGDYQPSASQLTAVASQMPQLRDSLQSIQVSQRGKLTSSALKQYHLAMPKRSNPMKAGTKGIPIRVWTNMFEIIFDKNFVTNAVHYDVTISPTTSKSLYKQIFEECRSSHFRNRFPAFDGKKNAYSANNLPFNEFMEANIEIYDREREQNRTFKIELKKVANIDLSWIKYMRPGLDEADRDPTGIQVLDIIMRHAPQLRYLPVGRSLFWDISNDKKISEGMCVSFGAFQSAILGWKPYLNVDVAHKAFPMAQTVIDLMAELAQLRKPINPRDLNAQKLMIIERYLKGLKVNYQIPNQPRTKRTYRVNKLGNPAAKHTFQHNDGLITVAHYFSKYKMYSLSQPYIPVLCVGSKDRAQEIALPAELCTIVAGQVVNRKLSEQQTSNMIKQTVTNTTVRKTRIENAFNEIRVNDSPVMTNEFHLSVDARMKQVDARILPPPELKYARGKAIVRKGVWRAMEFNEPKTLEAWTILFVTYDSKLNHDIAQTFIGHLQNHAKEVGMKIGDTKDIHHIFPHDINEIANFCNARKDKKLIIVILPDKADNIYAKIKQLTELRIGVLTQCVKLKNVVYYSPSTVKNLLLKINSKLNGINHTLNTVPMCLRKNACMLVGADVTHPSPDSVNIPSIAAVAASSNTSVFQYNTELRLQQPKEEMIMDLENIIIAQLLIYNKMNKQFPSGIIYYRDGVSEGQLGQVMHYEINAIKRACNRCKIAIPVTCLVVQKRHHVRFFPTRPNDTDDKNFNVKAGTIVDTEITHPNHIDFYLVSHASIQGTARPTKYRCICNEAKFTEDELEELTYSLCHMYARCTRSVSYPAPTYYAHLAAYRGRILTQEVNISLDNLQEEQFKLKMKLPHSPMCFI